MSGLPDEIIEENILFRLPVKSIARFKCVSRKWSLLFQNPNFIKNHLNHANLINKFNILVLNTSNKYNYWIHKYGDIRTQEMYLCAPAEIYLCSVDNDVLTSESSPFLGHALKIDYPFMSQDHEPQIEGSCNGLVCIKPFSDNICIWNPATREYKRLPEVRGSCSNMFSAHGFGFDCKNGDYKVLAIVHLGLSFGSEAKLYSLASNSWKSLGSIPYDFTPSSNSGLLHNGILHWIAYTGLKSRVIVCFNVSDETFHEVLLPNSIPNEDRNSFLLHLGIWEGKLCLFHRNCMEDRQICTHQNDHVDVWTMMDNKWSKHLKITAQTTDISYRRPLQTLQNGEILLEGRPMEELGNSLMSYDPKLERVRVLKIHGFPQVSEVETYIETLVALNSGTYVGE